MARQTNRLTSVQVKALSDPGRYSDGNGLYLVVDSATSKRWICFVQSQGKRREMGLGSALDVTLKDARQAASEARNILKSGLDPIVERKRRKTAPPPLPTLPTFGEVADELLKSLDSGWKSPKTSAHWRRSFETHAAPLRPLPVDTIGTDDVLEVLRPLWTTKSVTAKNLRQRIERVLDAAKAKGLRAGENPARWRGHLAHLLPKQSRAVKHFSAMPYDQLTAFMKRLAASSGIGARALEWTILTAAREGMTLGARWNEIDEEAKVWTVPGARMKMGVAHQVPLSAAAIAVLDRVRPPEAEPGALIFPAPTGKALTNMAMDMLLRRMAPPYVPHGFRSTFRDWAGDCTDFPRELAEAALAHAVGDQTERAYRRGSALEKRRELMEAWGQFTGSAGKA